GPRLRLARRHAGHRGPVGGLRRGRVDDPADDEHADRQEHAQDAEDQPRHREAQAPSAAPADLTERHRAETTAPVPAAPVTKAGRNRATTSAPRPTTNDVTAAWLIGRGLGAGPFCPVD